LFLVAAGLAVAGDYLGIPWLTNTGIIGFGLIACVRGIQIIVKGETAEGKSRASKTKASKTRNPQGYSGDSANLIGAILVLIGLLVIGNGILGLTTPDGGKAMLSKFMATDWGVTLILGLAGLFVIAFGVMHIYPRRASSPKKQKQPVDTKTRTRGLLTIFAGVILVALALGFFFAPVYFRELFSPAIEFIKDLFAT